MTPAAFTRRPGRRRRRRRPRRRQHDQHLLEREKSTAGLTMIRLIRAAVLLDRLDPADDEALRDRCRRCPTSRRRRRPRRRRFRHVLHPQPLVAAADDDALRARSLDQRAGRRVAIDQQLHFRRARARDDDAADDAGRRDAPPCRRRRPSRVPLSIVTRAEIRASAPPPMISAAAVVRVGLRRAARAAAAGRARDRPARAAAAAAICGVAELALAASSFSVADAAQADVAGPDAA